MAFQIPVEFIGVFKGIRKAELIKAGDAAGREMANAMSKAMDFGLTGIAKSLGRLNQVAPDLAKNIAKGLPDAVGEYARSFNKIERLMDRFQAAAEKGDKRRLARLGRLFEGAIGLTGKAGQEPSAVADTIVRQFKGRIDELTKLRNKDLSNETSYTKAMLERARAYATERAKITSKIGNQKIPSEIKVLRDTDTVTKEAQKNKIELDARAQLAASRNRRIGEAEELQSQKRLDAARQKAHANKIELDAKAQLAASRDRRRSEAEEIASQKRLSSVKEKARLNQIDLNARSELASSQDKRLREESSFRDAMLKRASDYAKKASDIEERRRNEDARSEAAFQSRLQKLQAGFHKQRERLQQNALKASSQVVSEQKRAAPLLRRLDELRADGVNLGQTRQEQELRDFLKLDPIVEGSRRIQEFGQNYNKMIDKDVTAKNREAVKSIVKVGNALDATTSTTGKFGKAAALAFKRYSAFLVGTFAIYQISAAFRAATAEALKFEAQITKIQQVLDISNEGVSPVTDAIRGASRRTGTPATEVAEGIQTLAQAGFQDVTQLARVADKLASIPLAATFDGIKETVEGSIAIYRQFNLTLDDTGRIFDLVNKFAAEFAVESADIFEGVKRGGAAFAVAGGSLEEFIALFSLLRDSTRESAESIGTFFKTGIAQVLKPKSQNFLASLGVDTSKRVVDQLFDLSEELFGEGSQFSDVQKILIAQQVTGERQFNKFLALLQALQKDKGAGRVKDALQNATGSFDKSTQDRLNDIGNALDKIKRAFSDIILAVSQDESFKQLVKTFADMAVVLFNLLKSIKDLIPAIGLLGAAFALKLGAKTLGAGLRSMGLLRQTIDGVAIGGLARVSGRAKAGLGLAVASGVVGASAGGLGGNAASNALAGAAAGATVGGIPGALIGGIITGIGTLVIGLNSLNQTMKDREVQRLATRRSANVRSAIDEENPGGALGALNSGVLLSRRGAALRSLGIPDSKRNVPILQKSITDAIVNKTSQLDQIIIADMATRLRETLNSEEFKSNILPELNRKFSKSGLNDRDFAAQELQIAFGRTPLTQEITILAGILSAASKQLKQPTAGLIDFIKNFTVGLETNFRNLDNIILHASENLSRSVDLLDTIITDPNALAPIRQFSTRDSLFESFGLSTLRGNLGGAANQIGKFLNESVGGTNIQTLLKQFAKADAGTTDDAQFRGFSQFIDNLLGQGGGSEEFITKIIAEYEGLFESLAGITGQEIPELLSAFGDLSESELRKLESIFSDKFGGVLDRVEEQLRGVIEAFEAGRQKQRELEDAIRGSNSAIFELTRSLQSLREAAEDRALDQSLFTSNASDARGVNLRSQSLLGRAGTSSFGDPSAFIADLLAAASARSTATTAFQDAQKGGSINDIFQRANELDAANNNFFNLQQQLSQRLSELEQRISAAASASDLLRQAVLTFRDGLQSAGSSVRQFTQRDLIDSFRALRRFAGAGGATNPGGALGALKTGDLDKITGLLGMVGNLSLGNGITGNQLVGNINQSLGVPFIAAIRSIFSGNSLSGETQAVQQELAALEAQQAAAAALEQQLRDQQIRLVETQVQLAQGDQLLLQQQLVELASIRESISANSDIQQIAAVVNQLFKTPLLVTNDPNAAKLPEGLQTLIDGLRKPLPASTSPAARPPGLSPDALPPNLPGRSIQPGELDPGLKKDFPSNPNKWWHDMRDQLPKSPFTPPTNLPMSQSNGRTGVPKVPDGLDMMGVLTQIRDLMQKTVEVRNEMNIRFEVSPMQINVALSAPDVLKLIGPQIKSEIMSEIGVKLGEVFGGDSEIGGRIASEFRG